jgi:DNA modification methylase
MPLSQLDPYWQTRDEATVRLYHGDALEVLERLPSQSVHCAVTSPPYWGLRKYLTDDNRELGLESHPDLYVSRLVEVFRELRRVLRDDGLFWLNLGDGYNGSGSSGGQGKQDTHRVGKPDNRKGWIGLPQGSVIGIPWRVAFALQADGWILRQDIIWEKPSPMPESVTNRCTKSHEYVFMFVKKAGYFFDGFAIREDNSPDYRQPRSMVYRREQLEPGNADGTPGGQKTRVGLHKVGTDAGRYCGAGRNKRSVWTVSNGGYKGSHFSVYPPALILPCIKAGTSEKGCCTECGAPWKRVVERTRQPTRPGENSKVYNGRSSGETGGLYNPPGQSPHSNARLAGDVTGNRDIERHVTSLRHLGWYPSCRCYGLQKIPPVPHRGVDWNEVTNTVGVGTAIAGNGKARGKDRVKGIGVSERHLPDAVRDATYNDWVRQARELCRQAEEEHGDSVEPCVVLDPFIGSGTTSVVCVGLGRYSRGIDLSEEYLKKNAIPRIEGELLGRPALASLVPR